MCVQLCLLESETKDLELRRECITTLGYLSQAQLTTQVIPTFINTVNQVRDESMSTSVRNY